MTSPFNAFATTIVTANEEYLLDEGPDEQVARAVQRLEHFAKTTPLTAVQGMVIDLAGFGEAPIHFTSRDNKYLLLSEVAAQLGMPVWQADDWARLQYGYAVKDQRDHDEERGDGRLGYECMRDYLDLNFYFVQDNPEAKPDAGGHRWSTYSDWLISNDRLPLLLCCSPWGKEYMDNTMDAFAHGMRKVWGDKLKDLTAYRADGTPAPGVELFHSDLTEEDALKKARRGPSGILSPDS
ncbi:hypothetical protein AB0J63_17740 [Streptosporangium canum]|uniref:hypothetical protein n=1 Tax=Streptosporangium canum TaxID=324952 RepID=UPI003412843C